jgi:hypothetical protein
VDGRPDRCGRFALCAGAALPGAAALVEGGYVR